MLLKGPQESGSYPDNPVDIGIEPGHYRVQVRFLHGLVKVLPNAGIHKNITRPPPYSDCVR